MVADISLSPEQFVAIMTGLAALVAAFTGLLVAIRNLHSAVNGRLTQLLEERTAASRREGELAGRDFMRRLMMPPPEVRGEELRELESGGED